MNSINKNELQTRNEVGIKRDWADALKREI